MTSTSSLKNKLSWFASYPKSGNTWLRIFIHAYLFNHIDINNLFATTGDIDPRDYNILSAHPITEIDAGELVYYRHAALVHAIHESYFQPVMMKTHNANIIIGDVMLIPRYLTRNAIYLVRDPRDVVCSFSRHIGKDIDSTIKIMSDQQNVLYNAGRAPHYTGDWSLNVTTWRDQDEFPVLLLKYEDLLSCPVEEFTKVVRSLGQTVNDKNIKSAIELCSLNRLKRQEKKKGFIEQSDKNNSFFHKGKSGYWTEVLSQNQVRQIEHLHGEVMESLGYRLEYL